MRLLDADTRRGMALAAAVVALLVASALGPGTASAAGMPGPPTLSEGLLDPPTLESFSAPVRSQWLATAKALGASIVRLDVEWSAIAPRTLPRRFRATDPGDRHYGWYYLDAAIQDAAAQGMRVVLTAYDAPSWAEGGHAPAHTQGTWRPNAKDLGEFARALAERYSGRYPDPWHPGGVLPRVSAFQAWNEPNLPIYLTPQWTRAGRSWAPASPAIYRAMLNAVYANVKAVQPQAVVLSGGTAPFGDPPGGPRMEPVTFVRELLCLHGPRLQPERCPHPAHFDVLDHHPYGPAPTRPAALAGDVSVPDLGKLQRILRAAERTGRALPAGRKPLWVTEIGWASKPPNPHAVSLALQERYLALAFYTLWHQGIGTVLWFKLRDSGHYNGADDGIFFSDGAAKPAAAAFRFPFVAVPRHGKQLTLWGRVPAAGTVSVQRQVAGGWQDVASFQTTAGGIFYGVRSLGRNLILRAVEGSVASPAWATH